MSPELLDPDRFGFKNGLPKRGSDRYAFGMVILEVLSGQAPFPYYDGLIVMQKVIEGERPRRPQGAEGAWFMDGLWETLELCWSPEPRNRPTIEAVLECLNRVSAESTESSEVFPPQLDPENSAGAANRVSWLSLLDDL